MPDIMIRVTIAKILWPECTMPAKAHTHIHRNKSLSSFDRMGAFPTLGQRGSVTVLPLLWALWILFYFQEAQFLAAAPPLLTLIETIEWPLFNPLDRICH